MRKFQSSITHKLFFAILAANLFVAVAVGVAIRLNFNAGFVDYVSERESRRLKDLAEVAANAYREHGSWEFLRGNEALWRQLNAPHFPGLASFPYPPDAGIARTQRDAQGEAPRPADGSAPPMPAFSPGGPPVDFDRSGGSMSGLLDEAKRGVVGNTRVTSGSVLEPVVVGGRTVGWLTGNFVSGPLRDLDRRFQDTQRDSMWAIGAIALLLSAIVALLFARGLLARVRRLAAATHGLAAGNYAIRVPPSGNDELGRLSDDFNSLALALDRAERMRRDFMADISHELRTPLAVLRGELEGLQDGIRTLSPQAIASLQAEVATLSKLVDDLYDLSLADVGALAYRKEPLGIVDAVESAVGAFHERLAAQRISVETNFPEGASPMVDGDPARLMQLFNNVLENTIRYTDPGGALRISVARDGEKVAVAFDDSAPGVPSHLLPRLFERLFRAEGSRNRASGGAGLGLSLCQSIVEAHGGRIRAAASPLGGVSIEIEFPLAPISSR